MMKVEVNDYSLSCLEMTVLPVDGHGVTVTVTSRDVLHRSGAAPHNVGRVFEVYLVLYPPLSQDKSTI